MLIIEYLDEEIPVYDITVEDNHNFFANNILVHNCTEIALPSSPSKLVSEELITKENGEKAIVKNYTAGEIALCNLSSFNLVKFLGLTYDEKMDIVRTMVRGLDNSVDVANYPVKEGKNSNLMYRYLGIGVMNYANYLAQLGIVIDTKEAAEETDRLFDELSYMVIEASVELAIEKGKFEKFYDTEWSEGILPIHKANKKAFELTEYQVDWAKWNALAERVKTFGLRNAQLLAIAPTATSGKSINSTESIDPIHHFFYKEEGTLVIPTVVPNFRKNAAFYKPAQDCNQFALVRNAAVRQKWLDQTQSTTTYVKKPDSLNFMLKLHLFGFENGVKTFYYQKQEKETDVACESCT